MSPKFCCQLDIRQLGKRPVLNYRERIIMRFGTLCATALGVALAGSPGQAAPGLILGDSIGVGLSLASGVKSLAHNSVVIGRDDILQQIAQVPAGTIAFISLGTNDAVGSIKGISARIEKVLGAVEAAGIKAVWVGPVCVNQPWNTTVGELDGLLEQKLAGRMTYVSFADAALCDSAIRGHDGVHFSFAGYQRLWKLAWAGAGEPVDAGAVIVAAAAKVTKKGKKHKRKRRHRTRGKSPVAVPK